MNTAPAAEPGLTLTLRDYFAAMAMQGLLASPRAPYTGAVGVDASNTAIAKLAYATADAMVKARTS